MSKSPSDETEKGSSDPSNTLSSPRVSQDTNTTPIPDSPIESFLSDINYGQQQQVFLSGGIKDKFDGFWSTDYNLQRDKFINLLSEVHGFTLSSRLTSSFALKSLVYHAIGKDGKKYIIKLSPDSNMTESVHSVINEWYILSGLNTKNEVSSDNFKKVNVYHPPTLANDIPGIIYPIKVLNLVAENTRKYALIFEDNDLKTIRHCYKDNEVHSASSRNFSSISNFVDDQLKELYKSASQIIETLSDMIAVLKILKLVHDAGFVYNVLSTVNILKSKTGKIMLGGFEYCFSIQPEDSSNAVRRPYLANITDSLPYMSPETITSANHGADYRTDFYSIGVILYELLVGKLPFISDNPSKLIRMHILYKPVSPEVLGAHWIAPELSIVIMRLLEKDPSKRYPDVVSLINDLTIIMNEYIDNNSKTPSHLDVNCKKLPLIESQNPLTFIVPGKLFGRDKENAELLQQFSSNGLLAMMIKGPAGSGKTTMLKELEQVAYGKHEFYIYYKFSKTGKSDSIYSTFMYGIASIIRQILTYPDDTIEAWRHKIISSIPIDLTILMQLIPEFRTLLGPKYSSLVSDKTKVSTTDTMNDETFKLEVRIRLLIKSLYGLFAVHGITMTVDDVQYCSSNEWRMFVEICDYFTRSDLNAMVTNRLFMTSRGEDDTEWVTEMLRSFNVETKVVNLAPISLDDFKSYWADSVVTSYFPVRKLAPTSTESMIHDVSPRSRSPSFVDEVLLDEASTLYDLSGGNIMHLRVIAGLAFFTGKAQYVQRRGLVRGKWQFDLSGFKKVSFKQSVEEYMNALFPKKCKDMLKIASIMFSSDFNLAEISKVAKVDLRTTFEILTLASYLRIITPSTPFYKLPFHLLISHSTPFDIPDEMIWELAGETKYSFMHDSIREYFFDNLNSSGEFQIFNQTLALNYYDLSNRLTSIHKYLKMGKFFKDSAPLVSQDLELCELYTKVLIRAGRFSVGMYNLDDALVYFSLLRQLITDKKTQIKLFLTICQLHYHLEQYSECLELIDKCEFDVDDTLFLVTKVRCLTNLRRLDDVLEVATRGLKKLGIEVSTDKKKCQEIATKYSNMVPLSIQEIRNMKSLPIAKEHRICLALEVMADIIQPTYFAKYSYIKEALAYQMVHLMHKYGRSVFCAIPLIFLGNSLAKEIDKSKFLRAVEYVRVGLHYIDTSENCPLSYYQTIYEMYISTIAVYMEPLVDLIKYHETFIASTRTLSRSTGDVDMITGISNAYLLYLTGLTYQELIIKTYRQEHEYYQVFHGHYKALQLGGMKLFHNEITLEEFEKSIDRSIDSADYIFTYGFFKLGTLVASGRFNDAMLFVEEEMLAVDEHIPNTLFHPDYYFLIGIILTQVPIDDSKKTLKQTVLRFFTLWNEICPANFKTKTLCLTAALVNDKYSDLERLDMFEEAIECVKLTGNTYDEAWVCFICARWLVTTGKSRKRVSFYTRKAHALFTLLDYKTSCKLIEDLLGEYLVYDWDGVASKVELTPNPLNKKLKEFFSNGIKSNRKEMFLAETSTGDREEQDDSLDISSLNSDTATLNEAVKACLEISGANSDSLIRMKLLECAIHFSEVDYGVVVIKRNDEPFVLTIGSQNGIYNLVNEPLSSRTDLCPFTLISHVFQTGEIVNKEEDELLFESRFIKDDYYHDNTCHFMICIPLKGRKGVGGALYLESQHKRRASLLGPFFNSSKRDLIDLLCSQATVALTKIEVYTQMEHAKRIAEEATTEKASFLANMSHEIRTPFNSLLSCSIFLLDTELNKTQKEYVETIQSSAMVTLNIIDGILAFSKIEHGSFTLANEPFSLVGSIENAIQLVGEQAAVNNLELVFFNKCPSISKIFGDETRFRQIIINLVGNAVKFTAKGHIIVEVKAKRITTDRFEITVSVEDTGIGIPKDSNNRVFGIFSQVDSSSRRVYGGSGLGLAISKKLADLMGGTLTFDSEEGVGSKFYFVVNMQVEQLSEPEIVTKDIAVIIDRHKLTRQSLYEYLKWFGLTVEMLDDTSTDLSRFNIMFIHVDQYENKMFKDFKGKIVLMNEFGKPLPGYTDELPVLMIPFQKPKVIEALKTVKDMVTEKKPTPLKVVNFAEKYPLSILIAEDNLINLRVALQHLKKLGYQADHAKDGVEVVERCLSLYEMRKHYDVIFMDIQMPRKDGITAAIELKNMFADKPLYLPEIVALTANVAGEDRQRSLECGMVDFIPKPILPKNLMSTIEKIGERRRNRKNTVEVKE